MLSICSLLGEIEDWGMVNQNLFLVNYCAKVHDAWHDMDQEVNMWTNKETHVNIDLISADLVRAVEIWMGKVTDSATSKS